MEILNNIFDSTSSDSDEGFVEIIWTHYDLRHILNDESSDESIIVLHNNSKVS